MLLFLVILLQLVVAILGYLVYINYKRAETATQYCETYVLFISTLYYKFRNTRERMKEVDRLGAFQADDEVGFVFKDIDESIDNLYEFITKYVNREEAKEAKKTQN